MLKLLKRVLDVITPGKWRSFIRTVVRSVLYYGWRVECPICRGHFRMFLPYGVAQRENAVCPRCGSLERHRLLWFYMNKEMGSFSERMRVLHFAPEAFWKGIFKANPSVDYITADLYSASVMTRMDIANIAFKNEIFDLIMCSHVLEHVLDDQQAMREMYRVLREGGSAIVIVPVDWKLEKALENPDVTSPEEREKLFKQRDHVRRYGSDVKRRFEETGFSVNVVRYVEVLGPAAARYYGLLEDEVIIHLKKDN